MGNEGAAIKSAPVDLAAYERDFDATWKIFQAEKPSPRQDYTWAHEQFLRAAHALARARLAIAEPGTPKPNRAKREGRPSRRRRSTSFPYNPPVDEGGEG